MRRSVHVEEVTSAGGLVTAADELAAEAGAAALAAGGNAVDAVVAAAFAAAVVEPCMSGLAGGTTMTLALRAPDRLVIVDGPMVTPGAATPKEFPLAATGPPGAGWAVGFYDWPTVEHHANVVGPRSVAVPGTVAALCTAQKRFGKLGLRRVIEPAITLAAGGFEVNWFLAAIIAEHMGSLARDPGSAALFLPRGRPLHGPGQRPAQRLEQPALASTLDAIARQGPDLFYTGSVGASLVDFVQAGGGLLTADDLAGYRATVGEALTCTYGRVELAGPAMTGFPTLLQALHLYAAAPGAPPTEAAEWDPAAGDPVRWATALRLAFADRARYMSTDPGWRVPWDGLRSPAYANSLVAADRAGAPAPDPFDHSREPIAKGGVAASPPIQGFTSQMAAVDAAGNLASLTQTLPNEFGARLLDPATGVLLNDGMAYFDPRPGAVNGIRPGVPVLTAMSPLVVCDGDRGPFCAVGASGGKRIISGLAQIVAALEAGAVSLQRAVEAPRIHAESNDVLLDVRWPDEAAAALEAAGYAIHLLEELPTTVHFARPNGVLVGRDRRRRSGVDPNKPGGAAVA